MGIDCRHRVEILPHRPISWLPFHSILDLGLLGHRLEFQHLDEQPQGHRKGRLNFTFQPQRNVIHILYITVLTFEIDTFSSW